MTITIIVVLAIAIGAAVYFFAQKSKVPPMDKRTPVAVVSADASSPTSIIDQAAQQATANEVVRQVAQAALPGGLSLPTLAG